MKPLSQRVLGGRFTIITNKSPPWKKGAIQFEWITSKNFRNMHETSEAMGFMRSLFHYYTQITPLEKWGPHSLNGLEAKNSEICKKTLRQWVLEGPFSIITYKSPPWKMGATQFEWITSKKIRNLHENTKAMGFIRSTFHYYTQITPLENGGQKICIVSPTPDLKTKDSKFRPEQTDANGFRNQQFEN